MAATEQQPAQQRGDEVAPARTSAGSSTNGAGPAGSGPQGGTRLEGIRAKVFSDRYALKNERGEPMEQYPEQMWARVARGIASVEATEEKRRYWETQFYETLRDFKFVPGGRILSGAGTGHHVTFYNCLPPDQRVLTAHGYRPIAEVEPGDEVVTHRGRLRPVLHRFERETEEPLYILRPKKVCFDAVRVTGEHPILVRRARGRHRRWEDGEAAWIPAREVRRGDYVAIGCNQESLAVPVLDLAEYLRDGKYHVAAERIATPAIRGARGRLIARGLHDALPRRIEVDADLMYLFGVWLGNGCVTHRTGTSIASGIQISFNADHGSQDRLERCAAIVERMFGVRTSVSYSREQRCIWLWANSMPLGELFEALFSGGFAGKRIPPQLMQAPRPLLCELLRGLFHADGCLSGGRLFIQFGNRELATQAHQLLMRLGYLFRIRPSAQVLPGAPAYRVDAAVSECPDLVRDFFGQEVPTRRRQQDGRQADGLFWVPIEQIEQVMYRGTVIDLEVEEDHSFVTAGVVVSNCYVIPSPEDSRGGILDNLKIMTEIMARGGGVGINLSTLRPRGSYIKTVNGTASGPCSWAELYSVATGDVIQQGGSRRGALMLMLNDDHPDIEEFITVKRNLTRINHANLSVCISDRFMEAVKRDEPWPLVWNGEVRKTLRARDLWNLICESAWASGEPGLVFIDRYNKESNTWYYEKIISVNPCITGDTLIYTSAGLLPARELAEAGQAIGVVSPDDKGVRVRRASHVFRTGRKQVYRLRTREGYTLRLTADHKVLTEEGWREARELRPGERLRLLNGIGAFGTTGNLGLGRVLGWLVGNGHIQTRNRSVVLSFLGEEERELAPLFRDMVADLVAPASARARECSLGILEVPPRDEARIDSQRLLRLIDPELLIDRLQVPPSVERGTREMQVGFLQALFTAKGSVQGTRDHGMSVHLSSNSERLLEGVQRVLLNLGIASRLYCNRRSQMTRAWLDSHREAAEYVCQASHELVISRANVVAFAERVGFLATRQQEALDRALQERTRGLSREDFLATFESLEPDGEEEVYDLIEPEAHLFVANGLVVHNCGEQGLPAWGVCNLGALNLAAFVRGGDADTPGVFDYDALAAHARVAMRFLDNVVDANEYFIPENAEAQLSTRRTGLGTMGLADALIKLHIPYGSDESLPVIERIYRTIRDAAYDASADLAAEKGPFPKFDREKYLQGRFIQRLPRELQEKIARQGIRNAVLLTQAPTGTTSLLAGVSSGIEPVYDFAMVRRDRTGEHVLYHPLLQAWKDAHPEASKDEIPRWFVSANDLTPEEHVRVQAKVQEYTDSSISKTVNAPNSHTVEQVKELYIKAYDYGCKGITYFRDGCREGVLSHLPEPGKTPEAAPAAPAVSTPAGAPSAGGVAEPEAVQLGLNLNTPEPGQHLKPRPRAAEGITYRMPTPLGTMFTTVTRNGGGQPFEVFLQVGKAGSDTAAVTEALGRLISLILRLPCPLSPAERLQEVVDQLSGIGGGRQLGFGRHRVRSLPDAVAQVLAEFLASMEAGGTTTHASTEERAALPSPGSNAADAALALEGGAAPAGAGRRLKADLCPECGDAALVYEEGCQKCYSCGYSEC